MKNKYKDWYILIGEEDGLFTGNITNLNSSGQLSTSYAASIPNNKSSYEAILLCEKYIDDNLTIKQ